MERPAGTLSLVFAGLLLAGGLQAASSVYNIGPVSGDRFELKVYKSGLMAGKVHTFVFEDYAGELRYDSAAPESTSVEFTVESDSIRCLDDWVSEKDRGKILKEARGNMLAVDKYPTLRFEADGLSAGADGAFSATGTLTIRDRAQTVPVQVRISPADDGYRIEGSATVSLEDFGLDPPSAALGLIGTKSEMDVRFALRAAPAKE